MKKLIIVCAALTFSVGAFAQMDPNSSTMKHEKMEMSKKDGVMMMDGKMMMTKGGKMSSFTKQVTLSNGTKVMSDGSYIKKDGTKMMMREGDHIDMAGNVHPKMKEKED